MQRFMLIDPRVIGSVGLQNPTPDELLQQLEGAKDNLKPGEKLLSVTTVYAVNQGELTPMLLLLIQQPQSGFSEDC